MNKLRPYQDRREVEKNNVKPEKIIEILENGGWD